MSDTEQQLAVKFIKAGLTPRFLESEAKTLVKNRTQAQGFTLEDLEVVMKRWDSQRARDYLRHRQYKERQKQCAT